MPNDWLLVANASHARIFKFNIRSQEMRLIHSIEHPLAKELADIIDHGRTLNRFERLIIVAPPHFYGLLDKHLSGSIKHLIKSVIQKDYTGVIERDLQRLIFRRKVNETI